MDPALIMDDDAIEIEEDDVKLVDAQDKKL